MRYDSELQYVIRHGESYDNYWIMYAKHFLVYV